MNTAMSLSGEEQRAQPNVFTPAALGPVTLRNRIIKAATFEASTPNGLVSDDLITYHRLPAAGGVAMTTVRTWRCHRMGVPISTRSGGAQRPSRGCRS